MGYRSQNGFTLLDLMAVVSVISILALVTVPSAIGTVRTFRRTVATRHLVHEIRTTQSLAVTRRGLVGLQWGAALSSSLSPGKYRIVRDASGSCGFPFLNAAEDGIDVIHGWSDLSDEYPGITIRSVLDRNGRSLNGVTFDSLGASVNPCEAADFPVTITIEDRAGRTEQIQIKKSGMARQL